MRQKNYKYLALVLGAILVFPTFASQIADSNKNGSSNITDPDQSIIVNQAAPTFSIKLQANPTTGYTWFLKEVDYQLITPTSRIYHPDQSGRIGAGGYEEWTFKATPRAFDVPHLTNITLIYARSWDLQNMQGSHFRVVTQ